MKNTMIAVSLALTVSAAGAQQCIPCAGDGWQLSCSAAVAIANSGSQVCGLGASTGPGGACPALGALVEPERPEPGSLHELVAGRFALAWSDPESSLRALFTDPARDFFRKALWRVLETHQGAPAGTPAEWKAQARIELFAGLVRCLERTTVRLVPTGTGHDKPVVLPRSTASNEDCASSTLSYILRHLEFTEEELSPFAPGESIVGDFLISAVEELEDQLGSMALVLQEMGGVSALEDLSVHLWEIGR